MSQKLYRAHDLWDINEEAWRHAFESWYKHTDLAATFEKESEEDDCWYDENGYIYEQESCK